MTPRFGGGFICPCVKWGGNLTGDLQEYSQLDTPEKYQGMPSLPWSVLCLPLKPEISWFSIHMSCSSQPQNVYSPMIGFASTSYHYDFAPPASSACPPFTCPAGDILIILQNQLRSTNGSRTNEYPYAKKKKKKNFINPYLMPYEKLTPNKSQP